MAFDLIGRIKIKDDGASRAFQKVTDATNKARRASGLYRDAQGRLRDAQGRFVAESKGMTNALGNIGGGFGNLAKKVAIYAAAYKAIDIAGDSVKKAMDFEAELSTIQALTGASSNEMAQMQKLALKMGADTKYNALEAAQGIEELLKAGLTPATVQAGGLEAALNLATAGGLGLADAAEIMSTALNAYKKDGMSAATAANILAGTANASATSVEELRLSLASVSAVAAGVGLSFKDTNDALGLFANNGLKGSDAGTSLKTMLQNLQPTTKDQIKLFKALGLVTKTGANQFYDAKGNIKPLVSIAGSLRKSLGGLTNQQRSLALETMFGTDAVRAATILFNEGADGVNNFEAAMSKVTALDVAKKKMDNAAGAVEQFRGAIETLQISALLPTMPILKNLANAAADYVTKYTPQITAGMESAVTKAKKFVNTNFLNNSEFTKLPTLSAKVEFVFDKVIDAFNAWYADGGRQSIANVTSKILNIMADAVATSTDIILRIGQDIGVSLARGVAEGIGDSVKSAVTDPATLKRIGGFSNKVMNTASKVNPAQVPLNIVKKEWSLASGFLLGKNHASGLDRVPYNGYAANLHRDEAVLTKTEAADWRAEQSGKGNGSRGDVVITGNTFNVRKESDIDEIARKLIAYAGY